MKKNIVLIGFMGSGKSAIAIQLGKTLGRKVIEMDELVLIKSGRSTINEIFSKDKELIFREIEIAVAKKLRDKTNSVISTGGGVVMNKIILDYLKKNGIIVFLATPFDEIVKRIGKAADRPLFNDIIKAKKLFKFRKVLYEQYADTIIRTKNRSINEITLEIIERTRSYGG